MNAEFQRIARRDEKAFLSDQCKEIEENNRTVGPGKSNLPFELRRKAGDCSRVTAGPIDLI